MKVPRSVLYGLAAGGAIAAGTFVYALKKREESLVDPAPPVDLPPPETPELRKRTPADLDPNEVEALARIIRSEAGVVADPKVQRAIGWVARNRFLGKSIYKIQYPWREQKGVNPPFSSRQEATEATRALAREILLADQSEDPTGGATAFFEPALQDRAAKAGAMARAGQTGDRVIDGQKMSRIERFKSYRKTASDIRKEWGSGSTIYGYAGPFELWGSKKAFAKRGNTVVTIAGYLYGVDLDCAK